MPRLKGETLSIRTSPDIKELLRLAAHREHRSVASMVEIRTWAPGREGVAYDDLVGPVTRESLALSHRLLADTVDEVRKCFSEYETLPTKMQRAESGHVICGFPPLSMEVSPVFTGGGAWWAYTFGKSETMPKNDVPNISAEAMPWGLDLAVNAEIQASQAVMRTRICKSPDRFEQLISDHGNLQFQALLKFEHQPRTYHWLPLFIFGPGGWTGRTVLDTYSRVEQSFSNLRADWLPWIEENQRKLSNGQSEHMNRQNRRPILALRLIRAFSKDDIFWTLPYAQQCELLTAECAKLKPLVDFFCK